MRAADPARSRIVLLGIPEYEDGALRAIPQVRANVADLAQVLIDPRYGGFPAEHVRVVRERASLREVGAVLAEEAAQAEDLLLFYYAGHGLLDRVGELYLGLYRSTATNPGYNALRYETVRGTFLDSVAEVKAVVVDSCYSGRAVGTLAGDQMPAAVKQLQISGTFVLAAAPANRPALVRPDEAHTAFTGRLLAVLREGIEHAGAQLTLGEISRSLQSRLQADGLPLLQKRETANADLFGLVRNARRSRSAQSDLPQELQIMLESVLPRVRRAALDELGDWLVSADAARSRAALRALANLAEQDGAEAGVARELLAGSSQRAADAGEAIDGAAHEQVAIGKRESALLLRQAADAVDEAERVAASIGDLRERAEALADLARQIAYDDPDRAESIAAAIPPQYPQPRVFIRIIEAIAATDLGRAESIAAAVADGYWNAMARVVIVRQIAVTDPGSAEQIAVAIADPSAKCVALAMLAREEGPRNPDRALRAAMQAESTALAIADKHTRITALARIADVLAIVDPDQAERIAAAISEQHYRSYILGRIARVLAEANPARAERIAGSIAEASERIDALCEIAGAIAAAHPDRAETIAAGLSFDEGKAEALARTAHALAAVDLDRARQVAAEAQRAAVAITDERQRMLAAAFVPPFIAAADPDRAERMVAAIANKYQQALALGRMAFALADVDPERAVRTADQAARAAATLTDRAEQARILTRLVGVRRKIASE